MGSGAHPDELTGRADGRAQAIERLDPRSQALVRLADRGLSDREIAQRAGLAVGAVTAARAAALARLADELTGADAQSSVAPVRTPTPPRRHGAWVSVGALALVGIAALAVALAVGSGSGRRPTPAPAPTPARVVPLRRLAGAPRAARGTAQLVGRGRGARLALAIAGLAPLHGRYEVWLYDSILDAVPLTSFRGGHASLTIVVRRPLQRYRAIDISLEPPDGNPNHSGQSRLRVATRELATP